MCPVSDGTPVNAANTNPQFLDAQVNTAANGVVALQNTATASGSSVTNTQAELNSISSFVGKALNAAYNALPTWVSSFIGTASDTIKSRIEAIILKFRSTSAAGGHTHSGVDGDGPLIPMGSISGTLPISQGGTGQSTASGAFGALSPLTTKGDLLGFGTSNTRLPVGSNGQALLADSTQTLGVKWGAVTGGSGQGGVNFLILDSSWGTTQTSSSDAETGVGNWVAYKNTVAGASPDAGMTGGSPTTTIVQSTTAGDLLNGSGSFKITKTAANLQGEGVSCVAYIPTAYRLSRCKITFPWKITSGSIASGDLKVFVYDVTNSQLITPFEVSGLTGSQGTYVGYFDPQSTTAQIRVGIHETSTNTVAYTMSMDDVKVGPNDVVRGLSGSNWIAYTPTFTGFGTVSVSDFWYRRIGDSMEIQGKFTPGTSTAVEARVSLPGTYVSDSSKVPGIRVVGVMSIASTQSNPAFHTLVESGVGYLTFETVGGTQQGLAKLNGNSFNAQMSLTAVVPISGWDANVSLGDSSTFRISSFLANGTRVTGSAPTALGQYRSYLRNASANTYTETNGNPTTAPNATDGILIYGSAQYNANDASNSPSRYEIFVGKNKSVSYQFYASTGRTGYVDVTPLFINTSLCTGLQRNYDPTTGIVTIRGNVLGNGSTEVHASGLDAGQANVSNVYFDIIVSENALSVGTQSVRSEVSVTTGNGHGSTNTKIRRFTTIAKSIGNAITYADSATAGGSFTINETGIYTISYTDAFSAVTQFGISVNSTQLTTDIISVTDGSFRAANTTSASGVRAPVPWTGNLSAGDVVRAHTQGAADSSSATSNVFTITKVNA